MRDVTNSVCSPFLWRPLSFSCFTLYQLFISIILAVSFQWSYLQCWSKVSHISMGFFFHTVPCSKFAPFPQGGRRFKPMWQSLENKPYLKHWCYKREENINAKMVIMLKMRRFMEMTMKLGQCKARPLKFVGVCLFISFLFCFFLFLQCSNRLWKPPKVHCKGALPPPPPMNKFACKLHGYIIYL